MVVLATWHCISRYLDLSRTTRMGYTPGVESSSEFLTLPHLLLALACTDMFCVEISCHQVASAFDWEGALEEGATRPAYLVGETQQIYHPP